ncbi:MAG: 2'-deoxycytidine 5'-triphosphate deaminase [Nanoarchaeota archaeon]|nr:2'-deoxycytidine 5'-triphosphate deaminase [Nanoarchaeota archaeon]
MGLDSRIGVCLASQHIRQRLQDGRIVGKLDEARIQPSSLDPIICDDVFVLDTETDGIFRPNTSESVYRTLLQLPGRQRRKVCIDDGFELKKGYTYLLKLEERVRLASGEFVRSSPKSSLGRLFLNTRLLADYNPCFDEALAQYRPDTELDLWLLVQPLAFNIIARPGLTLNQLRFFTGQGASLSPQEIEDEIEQNPILYSRDVEGNLSPAAHIITDGLQIHLDLSGRNTEGVIALRARHNPTPIDLSKKAECEAEEFFEPILARGRTKMMLRGGEHYLFASKEILQIPPHLNVELRSHSHVGFTGPLHFAGFIDNGFRGDLVFEVRMDEIASMSLEDGMPVSKLDMFRTEIPDKLYGVAIGSSYQGQVGPRPAKYFKAFDYALAARNYDKLDRNVLVQDATVMRGQRKTPEGFEFVSAAEAADIMRVVKDGFFHSRYDCESDEGVMQFIPYVLVFNDRREVFTYVRSQSIRDYGDERLFGKHSIGVGGHVLPSDGPEYIRRCVQREVIEEEVRIEGNYSEPVLVGTLLARDKPVDRVHFGLIYVIRADGSVMPNESSIITGRMMGIDDLVSDSKKDEKFETWSRILIPYLDAIYGLTQKS